MTTTLGRGAIVPAMRRVLWLQVVVPVLTTGIVVQTDNLGWLSVGGALIGDRHSLLGEPTVSGKGTSWRRTVTAPDFAGGAGR